MFNYGYEKVIEDQKWTINKQQEIINELVAVKDDLTGRLDEYRGKIYRLEFDEEVLTGQVQELTKELEDIKAVQVNPIIAHLGGDAPLYTYKYHIVKLKQEIINLQKNPNSAEGIHEKIAELEEELEAKKEQIHGLTNIIDSISQGFEDLAHKVWPKEIKADWVDPYRPFVVGDRVQWVKDSPDNKEICKGSTGIVKRVDDKTVGVELDFDFDGAHYCHGVCFYKRGWFANKEDLQHLN